MDEKINIILFDEEELTKVLIENYLKEVSFSFEIFDMGVFDASFLNKNKDKKNIIIANINKTNTKILDEISLLSENKNNLFLLISYDKSADLQVRAMRSGAKDFLFKPLIQTDFIYSINKIYKSFLLEKEKECHSMIYSIISIEEHVGKTFFTFNLAKELADISKNKVLYIDFNNNLNDIYTILNCDSEYNSPYFINKITEENANAIFLRVPRYQDSNLFIMGNGIFRNAETSIKTEKISAFLKITKKYFKYILIDTGESTSPYTFEAMNNSNKLYLITEPSLVMAEKVKTYINLQLSKRSVRIVLNKYNSKKEEDLLNKIEQALGRQIFAKIPKNVVATSASLSRGKTLKELSPELDVVKTYVKLANYMVNRDR